MGNSNKQIQAMFRHNPGLMSRRSFMKGATMSAIVGTAALHPSALAQETNPKKNYEDLSLFSPLRNYEAQAARFMDWYTSREGRQAKENGDYVAIFDRIPVFFDTIPLINSKHDPLPDIGTKVFANFNVHDAMLRAFGVFGKEEEYHGGGNVFFTDP